MHAIIFLTRQTEDNFMFELLYSHFFYYILLLSSGILFFVSLITIIVLAKTQKKKLYGLVAAATLILPIAMFIFAIFGSLSNYINYTREVDNGIQEVSANVKATALVEKNKTYDICYFFNNPEDLKYVDRAHLSYSSDDETNGYIIDSSAKTITILDACQSGDVINISIFALENTTYHHQVTLNIVD